METILYKKGLDPYTVHSKEALEFHKMQGWFTSQEEAEAADKPIVQPVRPIIVNQPFVQTQDIVDAKVQELQDIIKAKDTELEELKAEYDTTVTELNGKIEALKELVKGGPVTEVPVQAEKKSP